MYKKLQSLVFMIPIFFIGLLLLTFLLSCGEDDSQTAQNPYNQYPYNQYSNGYNTGYPYGNYPQNQNYPNGYPQYPTANGYPQSPTNGGGFNMPCDPNGKCPTGYFCQLNFAPSNPPGYCYSYNNLGRR